MLLGTRSAQTVDGTAATLPLPRTITTLAGNTVNVPFPDFRYVSVTSFNPKDGLIRVMK